MSSNTYNHRLTVHKFAVESSMNQISKEIRQRGYRHDNSKFSGVESELGNLYVNGTYDSWGLLGKDTPDEMKPAIGHHHTENDHHPEHFEDGVKGMAIPQLTEMVCDIVVTAKENSISIETLAEFVRTNLSEKYNIGEPLSSIIINTARQLYVEN